MEKLTQAQSNVLGVIQHFIEVHGFPPSRKEIADRMGFKSDNAAWEHVNALHRKGAIELTPNVSRGIKIL